MEVDPLDLTRLRTVPLAERVSKVSLDQFARAPGAGLGLSQWLATLHASGLLRSGFVPSAEIRRLRDYQRLRSDLVTMGATHVQHMQKALERLNLKLFLPPLRCRNVLRCPMSQDKELKADSIAKDCLLQTARALSATQTCGYLRRFLKVRTELCSLARNRA